MQKGTFDPFVGFMQSLGILLVVFGHSLYACPCNHFPDYSFNMPLFMFLSGYLLRKGLQKKGTTLADVTLFGKNGFLTKKAKRLLIPYFVISSLAFIPKALLSGLARHPVGLTWANYWEMLLYPTHNVIIFFWFLPTLFLIFFFSVIFAKAEKRLPCPVYGGVVLCLLLALHWWNPLKGVEFLNLSGVLQFFFYFALGGYCCQWKWEQGKFWKYGVIFTLPFSFVLAAIPAFWGKDLLIALNGIALCIGLAHIYVEKERRFMHHLFGASYSIYLFSWFPQVLCQQIFLGLTPAPWWAGSILAFISGVYIPLLIYRWILRYKETGWGKVIALLTGQ